MTERILSGAAVLAIAAVAACDRHEDTSRTQTTSANENDNFIERTRVIDEVFVPGAPNPAAGGTQPVAEPPPRRRTPRSPVNERSDAEGAREPWDPPPIVGTTTITSVYLVPMDAAEPNAAGEKQGNQHRRRALRSQ